MEPTKNFTDPTGTSILLIAQVPLMFPSITINAMAFKYKEVYQFFKFGLMRQGGVVGKILTKDTPNIPSIPKSPMMKQLILTFPPVYKERSNRERPLKGQLWPRTR